MTDRAQDKELTRTISVLAPHEVPGRIMPLATILDLQLNSAIFCEISNVVFNNEISDH